MMLLHNLISPRRRRALRAEYYTRLATVAALVACFAVVAGMLALVPALMQVRTELDVALSEGESYKAKQEARMGDDPYEVLAQAAAHVNLLEQTARQGDASMVIGRALDLRPVGVLVVGVAYDRAAQTMTVEGVAADRATLVSYAQGLEADERFENVSDPLRHLDKSADLPFTLTFKTVKSEGS